MRAEVMGLCFGVQDALQVAFGRADADQITIYGELVHNDVVHDRLREAGYRTVPEHARAGQVGTDKVLVTAHGLSDREMVELRTAGHEVVDTTCPLVRKAHGAALRLQGAGYYPVIIGKPGHVEVRGLCGDLMEYEVVERVEDAEALRLGVPRIGALAQTTFPEPLALQIVEAQRCANPGSEVRFENTICEPTRQRFQAMQELAAAVDVVVIVGGRNSNNTRQLCKVAEEVGATAYLVQGPEDLRAEWFAGHRRVGLSAGTSTLKELVEAVQERILALRPSP